MGHLRVEIGDTIPSIADLALLCHREAGDALRQSAVEVGAGMAGGSRHADGKLAAEHRCGKDIAWRHQDQIGVCG